MPYLIDGYNLLHAMGALQGRGPLNLEKARRQLLGLLCGAWGENASAITVVFDAGRGHPPRPDEQDYHGIHVLFAVHFPQADDLIEELIQHDSAPRQLKVVSDDHRLQQAARRRQCVPLGCLDFLEELSHPRHPDPRPAPSPDDKIGLSSPEDNQAWLATFADLDKDPDMKELFNPFDFQEDE